MPNPLTGQPWPWESQDTQQQQQQQPPNTTQRDKQLNDLGALHAGVIGKTETVGKDGTQVKAPSGAGWNTYTFGDGSTVDLTDDGRMQNLITPRPVAQTATQQQLSTGHISVGNQVYTPDPSNPSGPWILSTESANQQQLTDAKTVADTNYQTAQTQKLQNDSILATDPQNQQALAAKQGIDNAYVQAQTQKLAADEAVARGNLAVSQGNLGVSQGNLAIGQAKLPGEIAQTAATTQNTLQSAATSAGNLALAQQKAPTDIALTQAQTQNQIASAAAAQAKINQPSVLDTGTGPTTTMWNPATQSTQTVANQNYLPTDPGRMTAQLQQQAQAQQQTLQQQVQAGKLTSDQAASQFDTWWNQNIEPLKGDIAAAQAKQQSALAQQQAQTNYYNAQAANLPATLAQNASDQAQRNVISMLPYVTGKGYGDAVSNLMSSMGTGKFPGINPQALASAATYSLPNLQEIGRQGAAAALAHISPTAQNILTQNAAGGQPAVQPPVAGMPDLNSLLSRGSYGFGQPGGGMAGAPPAPAMAQSPAGSNPMTNMQGAPGTNLVPTATLNAMNAAPQTSYTIPGLNPAGMPGAGPAGQQSFQLPTTAQPAPMGGPPPVPQPAPFRGAPAAPQPAPYIPPYQPAPPLPQQALTGGQDLSGYGQATPQGTGYPVGTPAWNGSPMPTGPVPYQPPPYVPNGFDLGSLWNQAGGSTPYTDPTNTNWMQVVPGI
jgi:hypothetical protein